MAVSLNLLNDPIVEKRPATGRSFLAGLCFFLLALTFTAVLYEYYLFSNLYNKRITAEAELRSAKSEMGVLSAKLGDVEARLNGIEEMLDFMLGNVRAEDILPLLEACASEDTALERLEITSEGMMLIGTAKNELGISELYEALVSSGLFASVDKPCSMPDAFWGFNFTLQCDFTVAPDAGVTDER